jgi:hypothetical protein
MSWLSKRRKKRVPSPVPWLDNRTGKKIAAYRARYPHRKAYEVTLKTGGGYWLECNFRQGPYWPLITLHREVQDPQADWGQLVRLACWVGGYGEEHRETIQRALDTCTPTATCVLEIKPEGFRLQDCVGNYQMVTLAEGTF